MKDILNDIYKESLSDLNDQVGEIIEEAFEICICDFTNYKAETSHNGGDYAFWKTYTKTNENEWAVKYGTSAEFEYCDMCGSFGSNCGCHEYIDEYETVTDKELQDEIVECSGKGFSITVNEDKIKSKEQDFSATGYMKEAIYEKMQKDRDLARFLSTEVLNGHFADLDDLVTAWSRGGPVEKHSFDEFTCRAAGTENAERLYEYIRNEFKTAGLDADDFFESATNKLQSYAKELVYDAEHLQITHYDSLQLFSRAAGTDLWIKRDSNSDSFEFITSQELEKAVKESLTDDGYRLFAIISDHEIVVSDFGEWCDSFTIWADNSEQIRPWANYLSGAQCEKIAEEFVCNLEKHQVKVPFRHELARAHLRQSEKKHMNELKNNTSWPVTREIANEIHKSDLREYSIISLDDSIADAKASINKYPAQLNKETKSSLDDFAAR